MADVQKPDFNSALTVSGGDIINDSSDIAGAEAGLAPIANDWTSAQAGLDKLAAGPQSTFDARASGQNLTGAYWSNRQAEANNAQPQTMGDLGRAILASAKNGTLQASNATAANTTQQTAAAAQANQIRSSIWQTKQAMQAADLALSQQKFQIWQTLNNANNQMQINQATLHNNYINGLAYAQNAAQAIALQQNQYNINQDTQYIQEAIGAASLATAGWASSLKQNPTAAAVSTAGGPAGTRSPVQQTPGGYALPRTQFGA